MKIYKSIFKKFFENLKIVVVSMALIYFTFLLVYSFIVKSAISNLVAFSSQSLKAIIDFSEDAGDEIVKYFSSAMNSIPSSFSSNDLYSWFQSTITGFLDLVETKWNVTYVEIQKFAETALSKFLSTLIFCAILIAIVIIISYIITSKKLRKNLNIQTGFKKTILRFILNSILFAAMISLLSKVLNSTEMVASLSSLIIFLAQIINIVFVAWFIQGKGKIKLKETFNIKSVLQLILGVFVLDLLYILSFSLFSAMIGSMFTTTILTIPFVIYTLIYTNTIGESYIVIQIEQKNNPQKNNKQISQTKKVSK